MIQTGLLPEFELICGIKGMNKNVWINPTYFVQCEVLAGAAAVANIGAIFFASIAVVRVKTFTQSKLMVMARITVTDNLGTGCHGSDLKIISL